VLQLERGINCYFGRRHSQIIKTFLDAISTTGILSAPLMAKFGHRPTVMIGGIIACSSSVICSFVRSVEVLGVFAGIFTGAKVIMLVSSIQTHIENEGFFETS